MNTIKTLDQTVDVLAEVLVAKPYQGIPTRYPFTYGYDFLREHAEHYGLPSGMSRGEASGALTRYVEENGADRGKIVVELAEAYLTFHNVELSEADKVTAMCRARSESWKSLGLAGPAS